MKVAKVLIVGAGPCGLFLANLCQLAGLDVTVIEKKPRLSFDTKGLMLHAKALELSERIKIADKLLQNGLIMKYLSFYKQPERSFHFDFSGLETDYPFYLVLPQPILERILFENFSMLGGEILFDSCLIDLNQNAEIVKAKFSYSGQIEQIDFEYVFACDGAGSTVRNLLNIEFCGNHFDYRYILAEGELKNAIPKNEASMYISNNGVVSIIPLPENKYRVAGPGIYEKYQPGILNVTIIENVIKKMELSEKVTFKSYDSVSDYAVGERIAEKFTLGRVALVGDAAHIHSPAGGQSITTGFQDAVSLMSSIDISGKKLISDLYYNERFSNVKEIIGLTNFSLLIESIRKCESTSQQNFIQQYGDVLVKKLSQLDQYKNIFMEKL